MRVESDEARDGLNGCAQSKGLPLQVLPITTCKGEDSLGSRPRLPQHSERFQGLIFKLLFLPLAANVEGLIRKHPVIQAYP